MTSYTYKGRRGDKLNISITGMTGYSDYSESIVLNKDTPETRTIPPQAWCDEKGYAVDISSFTGTGAENYFKEIVDLSIKTLCNDNSTHPSTYNDPHPEDSIQVLPKVDGPDYLKTTLNKYIFVSFTLRRSTKTAKGVIYVDISAIDPSSLASQFTSCFGVRGALWDATNPTITLMGSPSAVYIQQLVDNDTSLDTIITTTNGKYGVLPGWSVVDETNTTLSVDTSIIGIPENDIKKTAYSLTTHYKV